MLGMLHLLIKQNGRLSPAVFQETNLLLRFLIPNRRGLHLNLIIDLLVSVLFRDLLSLCFVGLGANGARQFEAAIVSDTGGYLRGGW